ncbi:pentatricopeptide repeat-containing protein at1g77170 [Phtheirospermum japonicum]|uniref:Pentatricopeptide repeat-containing protein at1g77170 n=1 Tax=Phtheirospermum japonicum TaxID=374723 RepID=A0A830BAP5_9LAMI|nr:pentatricopeptide repeat-containing protein at1g77170 [Phtheirospermum japonicum]
MKPFQCFPSKLSKLDYCLQVSNCANLQQLRQILAHTIRTHFLQLHPVSFHYNNISRIYTRLDSPREALNVYVAMRRAAVPPDNFTFPIVLKAATQVSDRVLAEQVHGASIKCGLENDMYCESGLISSYSKVGKFESAQKVFDNSAERKLGSWNAIIAGLSQGGRARDAIYMFLLMMKNGLYPDDVTMVSVTSACGGLGDLNLAFQLHKCVFQAKNPEKSDILMQNSVIDMYGKCGRMDLAYNVFVRMDEKNVSSWTSMIVGYGAHGHVMDALACFDRMRREGIRPNHVTFVGVLSACVHGGMVQEGKHYFNMMTSGYGIKPLLAHYGCMADLLGRAGLLDEAKLMVEGMPMKANVAVWGCLMGACEKYGNVGMGEWVARHLIELEPENDGVFVVLSNIYANHGLWKEVERLREIMKERKLAKVPAYSLPESLN